MLRQRIFGICCGYGDTNDTARIGHDPMHKLLLDRDPLTGDDPTHGRQQFALFNGHYDSWCYLPMLAFVSFNDETDQHLLAAVLRHGTCHPKVGTVALLKRLIPALGEAFPFAVIRVRLDGGFACPEVLDYLDDELVEYLVGSRRPRSPPCGCVC